MPLIQDSSVFREAYDLLREVHVARSTFAKAEKYTLGEELERAVMDILLHIIEAARAKREWKVAAIDGALLAVEKAKILVRLTWDLRQVTDRRMSEFQERAQRIGRMLGGWRKVA